jgi:hypothetical protein
MRNASAGDLGILPSSRERRPMLLMVLLVEIEEPES